VSGSIPPEGPYQPDPTWTVEHWEEWVPDDPTDIPEGFRHLWDFGDGETMAGTATYGRDTGTTTLAVAGPDRPIALHEMETVEVPTHLAVTRWRLVGAWADVRPPQPIEAPARHIATSTGISEGP
jgi:hypothetical protein